MTHFTQESTHGKVHRNAARALSSGLSRRQQSSSPADIYLKRRAPLRSSARRLIGNEETIDGRIDVSLLADDGRKLALTR